MGARRGRPPLPDAPAQKGEGDTPDYRALQPFGQVPVFSEDEFVLFKSGAIVLHIGEQSEVLLPKDAQARARATQWLIAALNSIEPHVMNVVLIDLFYADQEWAKLRRPSAEAFLRHRLGSLSKALGDKPYLDGDRFTAGDLMMSTVLRILHYTDIVASDQRLAAYVRAALHDLLSSVRSTHSSGTFSRQRDFPCGAPRCATCGDQTEVMSVQGSTALHCCPRM